MTGFLKSRFTYIFFYGVAWAVLLALPDILLHDTAGVGWVYIAGVAFGIGVASQVWRTVYHDEIQGRVLMFRVVIDSLVKAGHEEAVVRAFATAAEELRPE